MNKLFDSHAHYDDKWFDEGRADVIESLPGAGIGWVVNAGADLESSYAGRDFSERYSYFWFAAGVHPQSAKEVPADYLTQLESLASHPRCVAIGEIGLDYYYKEPPRDIQQTVFLQQMELAKKLELPVIIHDREAHDDMLRILREYQLRGVVHCFSGSVEMAHEVTKLGMYLGFNGMITFHNVRKAVEVIRAIPLQSILAETDCPYMAPVPHRGKRCDSSLMLFTCQKIADIKGIPVEEVIAVTAQNAKNLYGIL